MEEITSPAHPCYRARWSPTVGVAFEDGSDVGVRELRAHVCDARSHSFSWQSVTHEHHEGSEPRNHMPTMRDTFDGQLMLITHADRILRTAWTRVAPVDRSGR